MKIYGVGTDIVKVDRIKKSIRNKYFISRIFNENEIQKCKKLKKNYNCYAKRFAAKEAFSKALGTGISDGINFNEIIVLNEKKGRPFIKLQKKKLKKNLKEKNIRFLYLYQMKIIMQLHL